ncbi:hypothetical protein SDRG_00141 [Saprolegnia diclina VS20]|uniref:Uncharacterized protein n=1 Tax=Saprolegnia diclina (strain VS20) TaxID=1156394 RepID=T0R7H0_SAPDV|nr:hypothetical protein SDRG_00141 [Saprolegnia diclina VS20]EQC42405.1 hypothetical protein SDRG_00141 [Saprolegnia diclina VS20]|eukprot:XP_008603828.1 hypothetical protein SDRG_00141 [Saprolegnia diclina VS20]
MAVSTDPLRASFSRRLSRCPHCAASYMSYDDRVYCTSDCKATAKILRSLPPNDDDDASETDSDVDGDVYVICVPKFDPRAINERKRRAHARRVSSPRDIPQRTMFYSGDVISY